MANNNNNQHKWWGLNRFSFYVIATVAILYLIAAVFSFFSKLQTACQVLQGIGTAIMIGIVAYLAWKYIKNKPAVWKVLYFVCLLVIILGIVLPLVA